MDGSTLPQTEPHNFIITSDHITFSQGFIIVYSHLIACTGTLSLNSMEIMQSTMIYLSSITIHMFSNFVKVSGKIEIFLLKLKQVINY